MSAGLTETIVAWQSKGLSNEKISLLTTADYNLSSKRKCHSSKIRMRVEFKLPFLVLMLKTRKGNFYSIKCSKFILLSMN